jgi:hypothetical protein
MRDARLDKEAVRAANRLEDVIPALTGDSVSRDGGRDLLARCPFHGPDAHPSLRINPEKQLWRCDPCDLGGDVFAFVQRFKQQTSREAIAWLADRAGLSNGHGQALTAPVPKATIARTYDYTDEAGVLLYQAVRYEPKDFGSAGRMVMGAGAGTWRACGACPIACRTCSGNRRAWRPKAKKMRMRYGRSGSRRPATWAARVSGTTITRAT